MLNEARVGEFTVAGQPTEAELKALKTSGYSTVVNVRMPEEPGQVDAKNIEAMGLQYTNVPFTGPTLSEEHVRRVAAAVKDAQGSVLVHCAGATRAAVVAAIVQAEGRKTGASGTRAMLIEGGFDIEDTGYPQFIERYFSGRA